MFEPRPMQTDREKHYLHGWLAKSRPRETMFLCNLREATLEGEDSAAALSARILPDELWSRTLLGDAALQSAL